MYNELIVKIRQLQHWFKPTGGDFDPYVTLAEAADAIEELSHDYEKLAEDFNGAMELLHKREKPRWIPVTEALPDFEGCLLCMRKAFVGDNLRYQDILYYDEDGFHMEFEDTTIPTEAVTHWMPLPPAPKEET